MLVNTINTIPCAVNTLHNPLNKGISNPCVKLAPTTRNTYITMGESMGRTDSRDSGEVQSKDTGVTITR